MSKFKFCPKCGSELAVGRRGGKMRQICPNPSCGWVHWDNPVPVVAAIVERQGSVVLVRNIGWPEGWFGLVTGFLERDETPEEGVLREVKEELGIDAELISFVGNYSFHHRNQLIIAYHLKAETGDINIDEEELEAYKEVPIEKVRPWPAATGFALNDWLKARGLKPEFVQFGSRRPKSNEG